MFSGYVLEGDHARRIQPAADFADRKGGGYMRGDHAKKSFYSAMDIRVQLFACFRVFSEDSFRDCFRNSRGVMPNCCLKRLEK